MKVSIATLASLTAYSSAFNCRGPTFVNVIRAGTQMYIGKDPNVVLGGNDWKPNSGGMRVRFYIVLSGEYLCTMEFLLYQRAVLTIVLQIFFVTN